MNSRSTFALVAALLVAALPAAGAAQEDPVKVFKQSASREKKEADQELKERQGITEGQCTLLIRDVTVGKTQPARTVSEAMNILLEAIAAVDDIVDTAARDVEAETSAAITALPVPEELLVGGSKLIAKLERDLQRSRQKAYDKTLREVESTMEEISARISGDVYNTVLPDPPPLLAPAPAPGQAIPVEEVPLRILALIAGSDPAVQHDGRLSVSGTADSSLNSGQVNVRIEGPGLAMPLAAVGFIDTQTGTWKVDYPQFGPGMLREGNYRVLVDQGGVVVASTIGVP